MTATRDPNALDARAWLIDAKRKLSLPAKPRAWTVDDFKVAWLLRDQFTRAELLGVLDVACDRRFDRKAGIDKFLDMMRLYVDGLGE